MRYPGIILLLLLFPAFCGCTQQSPEPVQTPSMVPAVTTVETTATVVIPKQINVMVWKSEHAVVVQYNGGRDAGLLTMIRVQIDNRDGKIVKTPIYSPEIGKEYRFPYVGVVNPDTINITGVFSDGTGQTLLFYYS